MSKVTKGVVIAGGAGTVLIAAAQTKPEDAATNIAGWLKLAGVEDPAGLLNAASADAWVTFGGVFLLLVAAALLYYRGRGLRAFPIKRSASLTSDDAARAEINEFSQLSMANRIVVGQMTASGNVSDGIFQIVGEFTNVWDEEVRFVRLKGDIFAELNETEALILKAQMITDPGAKPGKVLVVGFNVSLSPTDLARLSPMLKSDDGVVFDLRRLEVLVESATDANERASLSLWPGILIRGTDRIRSEVGYPQRN